MKIGLATRSEMFADNPREVRKRCSPCELLNVFVDCMMCFIHAGSAESQTEECAGRTELAAVSLYFCAEAWRNNSCTLDLKVGNE